MKIADMSERISVRNYITKQNERGDILNVVEFERCKVWANIKALNALNAETTPEHTNKIIYRVTIRYRSGLKPDDEIIWGDRRLKLISPPYNLDGQRIFTSFECEEVAEDGATQ